MFVCSGSVYFLSGCSFWCCLSDVLVLCQVFFFFQHLVGVAGGSGIVKQKLNNIEQLSCKH